MGLGAVLS